MFIYLFVELPPSWTAVLHNSSRATSFKCSVIFFGWLPCTSHVGRFKWYLATMHGSSSGWADLETWYPLPFLTSRCDSDVLYWPIFSNAWSMGIDYSNSRSMLESFFIYSPLLLQWTWWGCLCLDKSVLAWLVEAIWWIWMIKTTCSLGRRERSCWEGRWEVGLTLAAQHTFLFHTWAFSSLKLIFGGGAGVAGGKEGTGYRGGREGR